MKWLQRLMIAAGLCALAYCGYFYAESWIFQQQQRAQLAGEMARQQSSGGDADENTDAVAPAIPNGLIGTVDIPRLKISVVVVEGDGEAELRHAAGHIPGTAMPGEIGNVAISAHRDTFFRPLRNVRRGDVVTVTTREGEYQYRVTSTQVVDPDNVSVLRARGGQELTLVTCYPFYYIGAAPNRFIVHAVRIDENDEPLSSGG